MIEDNVILGKDVKIYNPDQVNIFRCSIGDYSFVGPFVEITYGVTIGKNCKIESHSFLCDGVTLEDDVFIGHGVMFTNDLFPTVERQVVHFQTLVKKGASLGSNCTVIGGVTIGEYSIIGAGSVVTRSVPQLSIIAGNPGKVIRTFQTLDELRNYMYTKQNSIKI